MIWLLILFLLPKPQESYPVDYMAPHPITFSVTGLPARISIGEIDGKDYDLVWKDDKLIIEEQEPLIYKFIHYYRPKDSSRDMDFQGVIGCLAIALFTVAFWYGVYWAIFR